MEKDKDVVKGFLERKAGPFKLFGEWISPGDPDGPAKLAKQLREAAAYVEAYQEMKRRISLLNSALKAADAAGVDLRYLRIFKVKDGPVQVEFIGGRYLRTGGGPC